MPAASIHCPRSTAYRIGIAVEAYATLKSPPLQVGHILELLNDLSRFLFASTL